MTQPTASHGQSPQVNQAAGAQRLGTHRAAYIPEPVTPSSRLPLLIALTVISALVLVIGLITTTVVMFIIGMAFTVVLAPRCIREVYMNQRNQNVGRRRANSELHLYDQGLVVVLNGDLVRAFRWDTVTVLQEIVRHHRNGVHMYTTYAYTMSDANGPDMILKGGFPRPDEWGPAIQDAVTRAQLPNAITALREGRTLSFGDIQLAHDAVTARGKSVPWSQIDETRVKDGQVSLKVAGKWRSLTTTPVSRIPNFLIFYAVAEELRTSAHRA
ncbi:hypothetical protein J4573_00730 [Actinomadura barringtoniae]|uniref:Uncharacterized protein n=1 Tax=Actinomadura barringtoniae TaxID=1427535 RepID=A0A939P5X1_9ACTN|nr:DUF6585 family protein [Actinomadura barringtoniae]MBO2445605.1 hypothetical protein [Actinomadura barringtoniae]